MNAPISRPETELNPQHHQSSSSPLDMNAPPESTGESPSVEEQVSAILAELCGPYTGQLPREALREAKRFRKELIPHLTALLESAAAAVDGDKETAVLESEVAESEVPGAFLAFFLLIEFEAKEAWPAIQKLLTLPVDQIESVLGDAMTSTLGRALAVWLSTPEDLDGIITDRRYCVYVRDAAIRAYTLWLRDGRVPRETLIERLGGHLRVAMRTEPDIFFLTHFVLKLCEIGAYELLDDLREAFRLGLVDSWLVNLKYVESLCTKQRAESGANMNQFPPTGIEDTAEELSGWAAFAARPADGGKQSGGSIYADNHGTHDDGRLTPPLPEPSLNYSREPVKPPFVSPTIRQKAAPVGRNDPCPCGSGKKYKKCCMR